MFCPSCGRKIKDDAAFCPNCGSAVERPDSSEDGTAPEDLEIDAALKSLDEIKHTTAKPLANPIRTATPVGVAPARRNYSMQRTDSRISQIIVAVLGALTIAVLLFVVLPRYVQPSSPSTPAVVDEDEGAQSSPIGDIPPIEELSAQDAPGREEAVIAFDAYDHSDEGGFILADSDTHAYTVEELEAMHLSAQDLEIARNEIYARHGRGFNDAELQAYFDAQEWYEQTYTPEEFDAQSGLLNSTEQANVNVIGQVEAGS